MSDLELLLEQRQQLAHLIEQLEGAALVDSPSLRLLTDSLCERRQKIDDKLDDARRTELRLRLVGASDVRAGTIATVVGAVSEAVVAAVAEELPGLPASAVDDAARLTISSVNHDGEATTVVLASEARPAEQRLAAADAERPALAAGIDRICEALETGEGDLLQAIAHAVVAEPVSFSLSARGPGIDRSVHLDRIRLQEATAGAT